MKESILILVFLLFLSCKIDKTFVNEPKEKDKAEKKMNEFYEFIKQKDYDLAKSLFSSSFFQITSESDLVAILSKTNEKLGSYKSKKLLDWKTKRTTGDNLTNQYLLIYQVFYDKYKSKETIKLISDNDTVKILGYNVNSEGFIR